MVPACRPPQHVRLARGRARLYRIVSGIFRPREYRPGDGADGTGAGWTRTGVSDAAAWALVIMASWRPFAGNLVDKFGARLLLGFGLVALGAGMLGHQHGAERVAVLSGL